MRKRHWDVSLLVQMKQLVSSRFKISGIPELTFLITRVLSLTAISALHCRTLPQLVPLHSNSKLYALVFPHPKLTPWPLTLYFVKCAGNSPDLLIPGELESSPPLSWACCVSLGSCLSLPGPYFSCLSCKGIVFSGLPRILCAPQLWLSDPHLLISAAESPPVLAPCCRGSRFRWQYWKAEHIHSPWLIRFCSWPRELPYATAVAEKGKQKQETKTKDYHCWPESLKWSCVKIIYYKHCRPFLKPINGTTGVIL